MELNKLKYTKGSRNHKTKIKGRGFGSGSKRGFKGNKGQGQRNTTNVRIGFEGGQTPIYRRTKKIGFNNYEFSNDYNVISITQFEKVEGNVINKETLLNAKLIKNTKLPLKIIGGYKGFKLDKSYSVVADKITNGAIADIQNAKGNIDGSPIVEKEPKHNKEESKEDTNKEEKKVQKKHSKSVQKKKINHKKTK